jgi:calcineurin-like phosphoesterase family protein
MARKIKNVNTWFSSDWHLFHTNIIKLSNRPFNSIEEMNEEIVKNWNAKVGKNDICFFLGDLGFPRNAKTYHELESIVRSLNGKEIHFIRGNHDKDLKGATKALFSSFLDYMEVEIDGQFIVMSHYPMLTFNKSFYGSWMLHGHCHGNLPEDSLSKRIDVGIDCWNYSPVSFEELKIKMSTKLTPKQNVNYGY